MEMLIVLVVIGIIGYIIHNHKKINKSSLSKQGESKGNPIDYDDFDEVVDGYEFCATLWPYTPLETLKHHGERVNAPQKINCLNMEIAEMVFGSRFVMATYHHQTKWS